MESVADSQFKKVMSDSEDDKTEIEVRHKSTTEMDVMSHTDYRLAMDEVRF